MELPLKLGIGELNKIKSHVNRKRPGLIAIIILFTLLGCNFPIAFSGGGSSDPVSPPGTNSVVNPTLPVVATTPPVPISAGFSTSTQAPTLNPETPLPPSMYYTQSGDTLENICARFGVTPEEITSTDPVQAGVYLRPGQLLFIPTRLVNTTPTTLLMPDSEVVYSPTSIGFDLDGFVRQAGGYLSTYSEYLAVGTRSGSMIIQRVAQENSVSPRLLLALLEYQSGWVFGQPATLAEEQYPLGMVDNTHKGLYKQLNWAVKQIFAGYYGWRAGSLHNLTFSDGSTLAIAPQVNAGTVAVQTFFSRVYSQREWGGILYAPGGFPDLYQGMFDSPWIRAQAYEPFFSEGLTQPTLDLPFNPGKTWSFTGGPHAAWASGSPIAALDFAPGSDISGCVETYEWVTASASGLVVRSENGVVILDLDGDGYEQTGWVILYLHIAEKGRAPVGSLLNVGEIIGHPSCEGGSATGTHVHIARKYNGEWIPVDSPLPFVLSGWQAHLGAREYLGTLTRDGQTVTASQYGSFETRIMNDVYQP